VAATPSPTTKPLLCRLNLHHQWRVEHAPEGGNYRRCAKCGKDDPATSPKVGPGRRPLQHALAGREVTVIRHLTTAPTSGLCQAECPPLAAIALQLLPVSLRAWGRIVVVDNRDGGRRGFGRRHQSVG